MASPSGWTDTVEETIRRGDGTGTSLSRQVELVLVDLYERRLIYDAGQSLVTANVELFEFETLTERAQAAEADIRDELLADDREYLQLETVVEELGVSKQVAAMAVNRLAAQGTGTLRQTSHGLVLYLR